jgi:hypothetical protein
MALTSPTETTTLATAAANDADKEDRGWNKLAATFQASPESMLVRNNGSLRVNLDGD